MSNETDRATPRPWRVWDSRPNRNNLLFVEAVQEPEKLIAALMVTNYPDDEAEANAALIVRAVNSFDALTAALQGMVKLNSLLLEKTDGGFYSAGNNGYIQQARAALALAGEVKPT